MTNDTKWADGLDEDIAFLREHDPKGLNVAFNHIPPGEDRRLWIKLCVAMARKQQPAAGKENT
jgi:hypothetical protein